MKLFLDANVLFTAAHNPRGKAALLVELAAEGYWSLHSSSYAVEEARRNMERKFPESLDQFERISTALSLTEHHPDYRFPSGLTRKDQPIFQAAMACRADYLLTGETEHETDSEEINAIVGYALGNHQCVGSTVRGRIE